jgi:hypothetical protein
MLDKAYQAPTAIERKEEPVICIGHCYAVSRVSLDQHHF